KAVLELSADELARRTELPKETAQKIILLMEAEFAPEGEEIELPSGETLTVGGEDELAAGGPADAPAAVDADAEKAAVPVTQPDARPDVGGKPEGLAEPEEGLVAGDGETTADAPEGEPADGGEEAAPASEEERASA